MLNSCADVLDPVNLSPSQNEISNSQDSPPDPPVAENDFFDYPDRALGIVAPNPAMSPCDKLTVPAFSIQDVREVHSVGRFQLPADQKMLDVAVGDAIIAQTPAFDENCPNEIIVCETADATEPKSPVTLADESDQDIANSDFSPRLTNFIESGFVPESPLGIGGR